MNMKRRSSEDLCLLQAEAPAGGQLSNRTTLSTCIGATATAHRRME
jgi:hypothetical protein